jgi:IPT/TIG domain
MRLVGIMLLACVMIGCSYGSRNYNPGMTGGGAGAPTMSAMMPNSAMAGSAGLTMTVNGTNFGTDAVVYWNMSILPTTFVSSNQVIAMIPASDLMSAGMIPVYVRTGGRNSNTMNFSVQ